MKTGKQSGWATAVAWILALAYVLLLAMAVSSWSRMDFTMAIVDMNENRRQAIGVFTSDLGSNATTALALIGSLWVFCIFQIDAVEVRSRAEIVIFSLANIVLASSYLTYFFGNELITGMLFRYSQIDIEAAQVQFWSDYQRYLLLLGSVCLAATALVCRHPRRTPS